MTTLLQDLRYGMRMLAKNPGFTLVAVLTLALGIGANTAVFSVMNTAMLRYLPVPDPQQLVYLWVQGRPEGTWETGNDSRTFSEVTFEHLRAQRRVFSDLMAFVPLASGGTGVPVRYGEQPEVVHGDMVSGNFFSGLGVEPARGRTFTLHEESEHAQVTVLSYAYWTRRFARNPSVLGQTLYIRGIPFTIIGIAARDFWGVEPGAPTDLWIPLQNRPDLNAWGHAVHDEGPLYGSGIWWCLMMIGRLRPGIGRPQALAQLTPVFQRSAYAGVGRRNPKEPPPRLYFSSARGTGSEGDEGGSRPLVALMAMVGLVLLIACTNVIMLLVARNTGRQREFSLRVALGASHTRLFRQLLAESLLLVTGGAAVGWVFAVWASDVLAAWSRLEISVTPDRTVLWFTLGISLLAALAFGLAPLSNAVRVAPGVVLKTPATAPVQDRSRIIHSGQLIVGLQMALCLVLLVAAGLLVRTLRNLETADLGLHASGLLTFGVTPPQTVHSDLEAIRFFQSLADRLRILPGVESATLMQSRIGAGWSNNTHAVVDGVSMKGHTPSSMRWNAVGPDYSHVLGIRVLLGRDFTDADSATSAKVAIINQSFARHYLPNLNPLGHHVAIEDGADAAQYTVVGLVADSRYTGVRERPMPMAYFPYTQVPGVGTMHFEVRTQGEPSALLPEVRRVLHSFGPDLPLLQPTTQEEQFRESYSGEQLFARLSVSFGLLAALLVATGLYGTLAYRVGRRTAEIGVRMALGAQRQQVMWMVLRESLAVSAGGVLVGLPLAIAAARLLGSMLFKLSPGDPVTFAAALVGIAAVTVVASLVPARRATKVDPMVALRYE